MISSDDTQSVSRRPPHRTGARRFCTRHLRRVRGSHQAEAASGHLSLTRLHRLPPRLSIIGVANSQLGDEGFRQLLADSLREFAQARLLTLSQSRSRSTFTMCRAIWRMPAFTNGWRKDREVTQGAGVLFYLAIPPSLGPAVVTHLGHAGSPGRLMRGNGAASS